MPTKTLDVVIATNNKFKTEEMKWFLTNVPNLSIHTLDELHNIPDVEEDGDTLEENAIKKAIEMSRITNWLVFASDIGVDIPGLGSDWDYRRPRRILGEHASEEEKARKLIDMMKELKGYKRAAYYPLELALAKEGELIWSK